MGRKDAWGIQDTHPVRSLNWPSPKAACAWAREMPSGAQKQRQLSELERRAESTAVGEEEGSESHNLTERANPPGKKTIVHSI